MKCEHLRITEYSRLWRSASRYEPEERKYWGECQDCGKTLQPEDYPDEATIRDMYGRLVRAPITETEE